MLGQLDVKPVDHHNRADDIVELLRRVLQVSLAEHGILATSELRVLNAGLLRFDTNRPIVVGELVQRLKKPQTKFPRIT